MQELLLLKSRAYSRGGGGARGYKMQDLVILLSRRGDVTT